MPTDLIALRASKTRAHVSARNDRTVLLLCFALCLAHIALALANPVFANVLADSGLY